MASNAGVGRAQCTHTGITAAPERPPPLYASQSDGARRAPALPPSPSSPSLRIALIGVIMLFVVALRWFATQEVGQEAGGGAADGPAILVAVVSFALYAASLGGFGHLPGGEAQTTQLLAFVTVMWVALVPYALRRVRG